MWYVSLHEIGCIDCNWLRYEESANIFGENKGVILVVALRKPPPKAILKEVILCKNM